MSATILKFPEAAKQKYMKRPRSGYSIYMVQERELPACTQDKFKTIEEVQAFLAEWLPKLDHSLALAVVRHEGRK
jgi:hypothetical protein